MKSGALVLSVGGTAAALVQTLGYTQHAGGIMLAANVFVILGSLIEWRQKLSNMQELRINAVRSHIDRAEDPNGAALTALRGLLEPAGFTVDETGASGLMQLSHPVLGSLKRWGPDILNRLAALPENHSNKDVRDAVNSARAV